jgi:hypothetical protein
LSAKSPARIFWRGFLVYAATGTTQYDWPWYNQSIRAKYLGNLRIQKVNICGINQITGTRQPYPMLGSTRMNTASSAT